MHPPRRLFMLFFAMSLSWGSAPLAAHADDGDAAGLVSGLMTRALDTIKSTNLTEAERAERLNALLQDNCDIPRITHNVLGRYWTLASPEEQKSFSALFARWVVKTYSFGLREIAGTTMKVIGTRDDGVDGADVQSAIVTQSGATTPVEWRLHRDAGKLRVVDIEVSGVSLARAQHEEFTSIIQRSGGNVGALNKELDARLHADSLAAAGR